MIRQGHWQLSGNGKAIAEMPRSRLVGLAVEHRTKYSRRTETRHQSISGSRRTPALAVAYQTNLAEEITHLVRYQ